MDARVWTLDDVREAYRAHPARAFEITAGLDHESFNRRPDEHAWSVGECIDHLSVVAEQILPRLDEALTMTRTRGYFAKPGAELPRTSWFDRLVVSLMGSDHEGTIPFPVHAPDRYHPVTSDLDVPQVLNRFQNVCNAFSDQLDRGQGLDLARLRVPALAFPIVHVRLGAWYAAHAGHQYRHLVQAERTLERLGLVAS